MVAVTFTLPNADDIDELVANMREQDIVEVRATGHDDLREVVADGVRISTMVWAARFDGRLACIFGCAPFGTLMSGIGVPWLLGTPEIPKHRRILVRHAAPYIGQMLAFYPHLMNVVHARNTVATAWLRRMGFDLKDAEPYGPHGEPFHVFEMKRHV